MDSEETVGSTSKDGLRPPCANVCEKHFGIKVGRGYTSSDSKTQSNSVYSIVKNRIAENKAKRKHRRVEQARGMPSASISRWPDQDERLN
jgi:hypothetical protein